MTVLTLLRLKLMTIFSIRNSKALLNLQLLYTGFYSLNLQIKFPWLTVCWMYCLSCLIRFIGMHNNYVIVRNSLESLLMTILLNLRLWTCMILPKSQSCIVTESHLLPMKTVCLWQCCTRNRERWNNGIRDRGLRRQLQLRKNKTLCKALEQSHVGGHEVSEVTFHRVAESDWLGTVDWPATAQAKDGTASWSVRDAGAQTTLETFVCTGRRKVMGVYLDRFTSQ
jgi:hypothetical protein